MNTALFAILRALHFGACLLMAGVWVFDQFVVAPVAGRSPATLRTRWNVIAGWIFWLASPLALVSGAFWFVLTAANMAGIPFDNILGSGVLTTVWNDTHFGSLWKFRLACWLAATFIPLLRSLRPWTASMRVAFSWMALLASAILAASLAWAGHGLVGSQAHLFADALHLLSAAFWPAGLLPYVMLILALRKARSSDQWHCMWMLTCRFSNMNLVSVFVLGVSGIVNVWFLLSSISTLYSTTYGRLLAAKVLLFCVALGIGAVNMVYLRPRLLEKVSSQSTLSQGAASRRMMVNITVELMMASLIMIIVGVLGLLPPSAQ